MKPSYNEKLLPFYFIKDQYGNECYYPWGFGKGFILETYQQKTHLVKITNQFNFYGPVTFIIAILFSVYSYFESGLFFSCFILIVWFLSVSCFYYLSFRLLTKTLAFAPDRQSFWKMFIKSAFLFFPYQLYIFLGIIGLSLNYYKLTYMQADVVELSKIVTNSAILALGFLGYLYRKKK